MGRPPEAGTWYSSGCEPVGKRRFAAVSIRAAPKTTALSSPVNV